MGLTDVSDHYTNEDELWLELRERKVESSQKYARKGPGGLRCAQRERRGRYEGEVPVGTAKDALGRSSRRSCCA